MSLGVVNLLRYAPAGWFWDSPHDNRGLQVIKMLFAGTALDESAEIRRSREVLHRYCYERFEHGNRALAVGRAWDVDHLIPTPPGRAPADIDLLDELWDNPMTEGERAKFFTTLRRVIDTGEANGGAARPSDRDQLLDYFRAQQGSG